VETNAWVQKKKETTRNLPGHLKKEAGLESIEGE